MTTIPLGYHRPPGSIPQATVMMPTALVGLRRAIARGD
jgi:hypothetical protein